MTSNAISAPSSGTAPETPRRRGYGLWLFSDTANDLSNTIASFAIPLVALAATGTPAYAGIIAAVGLIVRLLCTLAGGVLADRRSRTAIMVWSGLFGLAIASGFLALATTASITFATILVVEVLFAAKGGFGSPATAAALKDVVAPEKLGRAQAANQGRDATVSLAGGPIGGVLLGFGAWAVAVAIMALQSIAALAAFVLGRKHPSPKLDSVRHANLRASIRASGHEISQAFRWLFSRRDLRGTMIIATALNVGFTGISTTVLYSLQAGGHPASEIGWISTGIGIGMIVGSLIAPFLIPRIPTGVLVCVGIAWMAGSMAMLPFVHTVPLMVLVFAIASLSIPAVNGSAMGYFLVATPTALAGRANSAAEICAQGAVPLAPLIAGFGLQFLGRDATLIACLAICAMAIIIALSTRSLRTLPAERHWQSHAAKFDSSLTR